MESLNRVVSIWPAYVAAVASLVLSLLLLAGVLVVGISQVGRLVGLYNEGLVRTAAEDERRSIEIESLQVRNREEQLSAAVRPLGRPVGIAGSQASASSITLQNETSQQQAADIQVLEGRLSHRLGELAQLKSDLEQLRDRLRQGGLDKPVNSSVRYYRFVFGLGAQGLDEASTTQLRRSMQADGVTPDSASWVLEAGVANLDPVASREVYRLMLKTRSQLIEVGFPSDQIVISLNQSIAQHQLLGTRNSLRQGDLPMLLRSQDISRGPP